MSEPEPTTPHPKSRPRFGLEGPLPLLAACLVGSFTSSVYNTMVSVALPDIGQDFGLPLTVVQWVVLVYLLANSSTIAISGRLGDLVGARRIYRLGLATFIVGGVACALAPSLPALLAARPIQALGTGMFVVSVPIILTSAFPDQQRGRVLGLYGTAVFVGLSMGPLVGGLLTELLGWRGVFAATVLIGSVALWLAWRHVPLDRGRDRSASFDVLGSLTYIAILVPLLLALGQARQWGLASPEVLGLLGLSALAAVAFVLTERRAEAPVVDLRFFSNRYFSLSALASTSMFVTYFPVLFLMPFYLIQVQGLSPSVAGLLLSVLPICMTLAASPAGLLTDRFGAVVPGTLGAVLIGAGLVLLAQLGPDSSFLYIAACIGLVGAGAGFGDVSNNTAMMGAVPPGRRGMASGTVATTRYVGQSLGVALASAIFAFTAPVEVGPEATAGFVAAFLTLSVLAVVGAGISAARGKP